MTDSGAAYLEVMKEFFGKWVARVTFLDQLAAQGHEEEALLLACCYVETLGNSLYADKREESKRTFVRVLAEHGGNAAFGLVHPNQLREWLRRYPGKRGARLAEELKIPLEQLVGQLFTKAQILQALEQHLDPQDREWLEPRLWHATYAAIVYTNVRSEAVHNFPAINVSFGQTVFDGVPLPDVNYSLVGPALKAVLAYCGDVSLSSGKYYGHDFAHLFHSKDSGT